MASPVPWIADQVWDCWNPHGSECVDGRAPVEEPQLEPVAKADLLRVPRKSVSVDPALLPPRGIPEQQRALLEESPKSACSTFCPVWPICCERLTTLVNSQGAGLGRLELEALGPLERAYLETEFQYSARVSRTTREQYEAGLSQLLDELKQKGAVDGLNVFQCRTCGRSYVASCHP